MTSKKCFIASPIGGAGDDVRKRSDLVKRFVIDEALADLGYETIRADQINQSGEITTQIVSNLIETDLLIADLTGHNANVFYELAIRHAFKLPYIQIIESDEKIPFDVQGIRTIHLDHRDLESAANARNSIREMVLEIESGTKEVESPVARAVTRSEFTDSENPEKKEIAQLSDSIERIESVLRNMQSDSLGRNPNKISVSVRRHVEALETAVDGLVDFIHIQSTKRELFSQQDVDLLMNRITRVLNDENSSKLKSVYEQLPPF